MLGPDHPDTLASANNLGNALQGQGQYKSAEAMYQRPQEGRESAGT